MNVIYTIIMCLALLAGQAMADVCFVSPTGELGFYINTGAKCSPVYGTFVSQSASVQYSLNVPFTATGIGTNSYDFNGSSHYVSVADDDAFSPAAMSVCAWVYRDTSSGYDTIFNKNNSSEYSFTLAGPTLNVVLLVADATGGGNLTSSSTNNVTADATRWMFVCGTWDGGILSSSVEVYVDCVASGTESKTGTFNGIVNSAGDVNIGRRSGGDYLDGKIMNASFWNTAISTAVCEAAMSAPSYAGYAGSKTNLVAWWDLQADVEDKHSTYEGSAQGGVAAASPSAYPLKDASNPVLLAGTQVLSPTVFPTGDVTTGSLTITDTSTGTVSLTGTQISLVGSGAHTTTGFLGPAITRTAGKAVIWSTLAGNENYNIGFHNAAAVTGSETYILGTQNTTMHHVNATAGTGIGQTVAVKTGTNEYYGAIVLGGYDSSAVPSNTGLYGAAAFIKSKTGAEYPSWRRLWSWTGVNTATMYPMANIYGAGGATVLDNLKVPADNINSSIFQPYALDTMTGSNGDLLTAHTMDVGSGWTKRVSDSVWDIDTNKAEMESVGTNPANNGTLRYIYTPTVADGIFSNTIYCSISPSRESGIAFRISAETTNGINLWIYRFIGDGTNCDEYLTKYVDGTGTNIYANASGTATGSYYSLTVQAIGDTIRFYKDGVRISSDVTDAFNNTATGAGIWGTTAGVIDKAYDNFIVHGATTNGNGQTYDSFFTRYGY